jgi:glycosyltransferase involved in cell wall biosynthesis
VIRAVGVVIPAHDEEALLADCIDSVLVARRALPDALETCIVVVLDACTDESEAIVRLRRYRSIAETWRARHAGVVHVLEQLGGAALDGVWIATTDADSRVPSTWLEEHVALANAGADGVAGVIRVDDWG